MSWGVPSARWAGTQSRPAGWAAALVATSAPLLADPLSPLRAPDSLRACAHSACLEQLDVMVQTWLQPAATCQTWPSARPVPPPLRRLRLCARLLPAAARPPRCCGGACSGAAPGSRGALRRPQARRRHGCPPGAAAALPDLVVLTPAAAAAGRLRPGAPLLPVAAAAGCPIASAAPHAVVNAPPRCAPTGRQ